MPGDNGPSRSGRPRAAIGVQRRSAAWRAVPGAAALCRRAARAALTAAEGNDGDVAFAIVLADDALVRDLNRRFRGQDKPTNVLSFPGDESAAPGAARELGDVVLAWETVAREAAEQGKPAGQHLAHLVVHGVLHLLGYDHVDDREAAAMERLEVAVLGGLGIADPYRAVAA